jgi:hypothetical protein
MNQYAKYDMPQLVALFEQELRDDYIGWGYRQWIEERAFGFGERCFLPMWKHLAAHLPEECTFLEVGVFRGQVLGWMGMMAQRYDLDMVRYGVTPLDSTDGHWESDYRADIELLHDTFGIPNDYRLIVGQSQHPDTHAAAKNIRADVVYIDGGHSYEVVKSDLDFYPRLVKPGGYLVIDDCNNAIDMPDGYFRGILSVSKAVDERFPPYTPSDEWELVLNLVHNRILRKKL